MESVMCNVPQQVNEYDHEMPQSHSEEEIEGAKATQQQRRQLKKSNQLFLPRPDDCKNETTLIII